MTKTSASKADPKKTPKGALPTSRVAKKTVNPRKRPKKVPKALRELSTPAYRGAIPRVEGPKLDEFPHRAAAINFRALLSDPEAQGQAHVFEVEIRSKIYALKIV